MAVWLFVASDRLELRFNNRSPDSHRSRTNTKLKFFLLFANLDHHVWYIIPTGVDMVLSQK